MGQSGSYECDSESRSYLREYHAERKPKYDKKFSRPSDSQKEKKTVDLEEKESFKSSTAEGPSTEIICGDTFPIEGHQGDLFFDTGAADLYVLDQDEWKLKKNLTSCILNTSFYDDLVIGFTAQDAQDNKIKYYTTGCPSGSCEIDRKSPCECNENIVINVGDIAAQQNNSYRIDLFNKGCQYTLRLSPRIIWDDGSNKEIERYVNIGDISMVNYAGDYKSVVPITLDPMDLKEPITLEKFNARYAAINPFIGYTYLSLYSRSDMLGKHKMYLYIFSDPILNTNQRSTSECSSGGVDQRSMLEHSSSSSGIDQRSIPESKPLPIKTIEMNMNILEALNVTIRPSGDANFIFTEASGWLETNLVHLTFTNNNNYPVTIKNAETFVGTVVMYDTQNNEITEAKIPPKQQIDIYIKLTRTTPYMGGPVYSYIEFYGSFVNYANAFIGELDGSLILKENINLPNIYFYQTPVESPHVFTGTITNIYNQDIKIGIANLIDDINISTDTTCSISFNGSTFDNTTTWEYTIPANTPIPFTMTMTYSGDVSEPWIFIGASFRWTNKTYNELAFATTAIMYNEGSV